MADSLGVVDEQPASEWDKMGTILSLDKNELFVDGHVHIYPFMSIQSVLDAASRNGSRLRDSSSTNYEVGVLLVADPVGVCGFDRLVRHGNDCSSEETGHWLCEDCDERSVTFRQSSGTKIIAIRGQQLITHEGLEVLGIGYNAELPSGLILAKMVERISAAGGLSIIAWGVGKWIGRRGRLVTDMIISETGRPDIMLADNGGRPWCWSRVPQFETAAERGMRVVAGTDPLPLKGEENRVGSYGFRMRVDQPAGQSIVDTFRNTLGNQDSIIQTIGEHMTIGGFVSNQLRLRLRRFSQ